MIETTLKKYDLAELTPEAATAAVNAATIERRDSEFWTWAGLASEFGAAKIGAWHTAIKAAGGEWIVALLAGRGIRLDDSETRANLTSLQLAGVLSEEDVTAVLALGISMQSPWQAEGCEGEATLEAVTTALDSIAAADRRLRLKNWLWTSIDAVAMQVETDQLTTEAEIQTAVAAALEV